ncbi:MAG: PHA/PHB synthase family protein [Alphaproteobacteria bacterium]
MKENISEELTNNLVQITNLYQEILVKLASKKEIDVDPFNVTTIVLDAFGKLMANPQKLVALQYDYFQNYMSLLENVQKRHNGDNILPLYNTIGKDNRFKDEAWDNNIYFDFLKQIYLMNSNWMQNLVHNIEDIDSKTAYKINFFTKQLIDALSPSNFAISNPEVIREIFETKGENLVKGLKKLSNDIERSKKLIEITTANDNAFSVGENIATTKGKIIYQNDLVQLIKFDNTCEKTYERPLLIIPAWINKYYILDLSEKNSFVRWLLKQGFSVYIISWVNPDKTHADKDFEDYMQQGILDVVDFISKATGSNEINAIGYCLGGTLLASTLAYMASIGDNRIASATFLTTLIDFEQAGELQLFTDEENISKIEKRMEEEGYCADIGQTFNMLKSKDMVWNFFVNNYLLGRDPNAFDLLYWTSDTTRLPAKMHSFYLRNMYQKNLLAQDAGLKLKGEDIYISKIKIPCYFLSTKDDHIAPWHSTYNVLHKFSDKIFTLTASGHVAGVVNHPNSGKYCYWTNNKLPKNSEEWLDKAKENPGSWWEHWLKWSKKHSGALQKPKALKIKAIESAPGSYVKMR